MLGARRQLERIARPDDHVCILARFERTEPSADAPGSRRFECDRPKRRVAIHSIRDRVACLLAQVAGVVGVEGREDECDSRPRQASRVLERRAERVEARDVGERLDHHRHLSRRQLGSHAPALDRAHQDQLQVELVGEPHRREQIARAVGADRERHLAADDRTQRFEIEPAARVRTALRAQPRRPVAVEVDRILQRLAQSQDRRRPRPAFRCRARLAKRREHRHRRLDDSGRHLRAGQIEHRTLADQDVARHGREHDGAGDPFDPRHRDDRRLTIETVDDVECSAQLLVGRRLIVGPLRTALDLDDADLRRRLDPAGRHDLPGRVDNARPRRHLDGGADRGDLAGLDDDRSTLDRRARHRQHAGVGDGDRFSRRHRRLVRRAAAPAVALAAWSAPLSTP